MGLFSDKKYISEMKKLEKSSPSYAAFNAQKRKGVVEDIKDPTGNNRVKVRVTGVHTSDKRALSTDKLIWMDVKPAIGNGGGKGQTSNLQIGQIVDVEPTNVSETVFEVVGMSNILSDLSGTDRNYGSTAEGDDKRIGKFLAPLLASGDAAKLAMTVYATAMAGITKYISAFVDDGQGGYELPPEQPPRSQGDGFDEQMTVKCRDVDWANDPAYYFDPTLEHNVDIQEILDYITPGSPPGTLTSATAEGLPDPYDPLALVPPGQTIKGPEPISKDDYDLDIFANTKYLTVLIYSGLPHIPANIIGKERAKIENGELFIPKNAAPGIYNFDMILKRKRSNNQKLSFIFSIRVDTSGNVHTNNERKPDYNEWPPNQSAERLSIPIPYDQISRQAVSTSGGGGGAPQPRASADDSIREVNIVEPALTNDQAKAWYCDVKDNGRVSVISDATKGNETYAVYHSTKPSGGEGKDSSAIETDPSQGAPTPADPNAKKEKPDVSRFEFNPKGELIQKSTGDMFLVSSESLNILVDNAVQQKVKEMWTLHCPVVQIKGDVRIEGKLLVTEKAEFKNDVRADGEVVANASAAESTLSQHVHPSDNTPPTPGS